MTKLPLDRLFKPRSVAIVGASAKPGALGASVLDNLQRHGFGGAIHLINPNRDSIGNRPCLRSIADLPFGVDVAVLAIPGTAVLDAVRQAAERGVGALVIFSAGFAEGGDEGMAAQREVARLAAHHGMVVEGPNCLGLTNYVDGVALTFVATPPIRLEGRAGIAIVSQSGAMAVVLGTTLMSKALDICVSVSTGNEAASGVEDYVDYLLDSPTTSAIAMIVEQFRDPKRFLDLASRARQLGKPIILLHPGRSSAARDSAATHTGAMAGDWQLMRMKVERAGVIFVESLEELGDVTDIVVRRGPLAPGGIAVLTESGAFKALTLDLADLQSLELPPIEGATAAALRDAIPDFIPISNPMDLTAQSLVDPDLYRRTLAPILADEKFAAVVLGIILTDQATAARKLPPIIAAIRSIAPTKHVLFAALDEGAEIDPAYAHELRALGVPFLPTAERTLRALARLARASKQSSARAEMAPIRLPLGTGGVIPEYRAKLLLAEAGIPFAPGGFASSLEEARQVARKLGYPVAIKAQSAALSHKSDAGGVILNLADETALDAAWTRLHANVAAYDPALELDGVLVEAMGGRGLELIIGARSDPQWGPAILVGFGGVQAELIKDVRLLPADLPHEEILAELRLLKGAALLDGYRGSPALDIDAVARIVKALGRVLIGTPEIREIDLNPVVVASRGEGAVALDALILAE